MGVTARMGTRPVCAAHEGSPKPAMNPRAQAVANSDELLPRIFAGLFGAFLGLCLLKFGNPPITEKWVTAPTRVWELLLGYPWPIAWAYWLLALVGVVGLAVARRKSAAAWWLVALPLVWLVWQFLAGTQSVDPELTRPTLKHFAACVLCFYLGYFSLSRVQRVGPFWVGLICGLLVVLAVGWEQQFGGLKETRRYFFLYIYPHVEGGIARVSEEDVERPHLLDSVLSQHPGRGPAAAAARHPGGAVASRANS